MAFTKLKKNLLKIEIEDSLEELDDSDFSEVEVYSDSLQQALNVAAKELNTDISTLDYEILEKGSSGFLGVGRLPYKVRVKKMEEDSRWSDLEDLNVSLDGKASGTNLGESSDGIQVSSDGKILVRIYKSGIFVKLIPAMGNGKKVSLNKVEDKLKFSGVLKYDLNLIKPELDSDKIKLIKVGDWIPKPEADSTLTVEIGADEMSATITISSPRPGGRHLKTEEVVAALKSSGVLYGHDKIAIENALDDEKYSQPIIAAKGDPAVNGKNGSVDYKVRIDKTVEFKEDESGRIDFLAKDMVENVVQGQILAELTPAEKGKQGRTVTNRLMPAEDGHAEELKAGKGTMLSEDGKRLVAEINGQVTFIAGKIHVEEIYTVGGDVGLESGNIMFLGSVIVRGSITDNMQVKAAGNIEVGGNVQKAHLEAEGDITIRQGINGREEAVIESSTGSVMSKFIQSAKVSVGKDVIIAEGILHSYVDASGKVICNGKRAQIVGGEIMAGEEIRVKNLGSSASAQTKVTVGTNPKILQQIKQMDQIKEAASEKLVKIEQNIRTLNQQKITLKESFPEEKEIMMVKMLSAEEKINERIKETVAEKEQLNDYMKQLATNGKVHVEKTLFPGVTVEINNAIFHVKDEYQHVTLVEEAGNIKILPYEEDKTKKKRKGWRK